MKYLLPCVVLIALFLSGCDRTEIQEVNGVVQWVSADEDTHQITGLCLDKEFENLAEAVTYIHQTLATRFQNKPTQLYFTCKAHRGKVDYKEHFLYSFDGRTAMVSVEGYPAYKFMVMPQ